ncbi:MAG: TraR/DksA family transcriptional regulator [Actinomycetota bacterium]
MTSIAMEETRALLEDERRRLTQIRQSLTVEVREGDLTILAHVDAQLADVDRAMERVEQGSYGVCEACGQPIDADRLRARPAARLCVDDQARRERAAT